MKKYIQNKSENKGTENFKCEKCEKGFATNHGLTIHIAWHTKNALSINKDNQNLISTKTADNSINENKLKSSRCEWCAEIFADDMKYKTITALLQHRNSCCNKP